MSFMLVRLQEALRIGVINKAASVRCFSRGRALCNEETADSEEPEEPKKYIDPAKDRRNPVSVETSIRYVASDAYKETYGDNPVWVLFRRNFKGQIAPRKTRKLCIRAGVISTGSPCPICRDEYLVLDHRNVDLLKQFISPYTGEILHYLKTNLCQKQHMNLRVAVHRAKDYGTITFDVPFREYNYSDWYKPEEKAETN